MSQAKDKKRAASDRMVVALDVGGTKLAAGRYVLTDGVWRCELKRQWVTAEVADPARVVTELAGGGRPDAVGIGVAGPVAGRTVRLTNLPWTLDADALAVTIGAPVTLMNDLEALAHGALALAATPAAAGAFQMLSPGTQATGHRILVAAGTGLGVALMLWDGRRHLVFPSEAGHMDFAPANAEDEALLARLRSRYQGHVSWERVASGGDGFANLCDFLIGSGRVKPSPAACADLAAAGRQAGPVVVAAAQRGEAWAEQVLIRFCGAWGAAAGNVALTALPRGGVMLGGGLAVRLAPFLAPGSACASALLAGFRSKGRFETMLASMPVSLLLEPAAALLGAARRAIDCGAEGHAP